MIFVFGVTATLASAFTEAIARLVGLRGAYLLTGLRELVDGGAVYRDLRQVETDYQNMQDLMRGNSSPSPLPSVTGALLGGPILSNQGVAGQMSSRQLTLGPIRTTGRLTKMTATGGDVSRFRAAVQCWYDDHMDRVSSWYKLNAAKITLVAGAILILLLNVNALTIGRTLYTESAVSAAVSTVAAKGTNCPAGKNSQDCLTRLEAQLSAAATAGLPIGWGTLRDCRASGARCNWMDRRGLLIRHGGSFGQFVLVLIGFLIMIVAIVPGAQFWFGLLTKIGTLRSTGPKPVGAGN